MKAGDLKAYKDVPRNKEILVEVVAVLKVEDAKNKDYIGKTKIMVQENYLCNGFLVDEDELYEYR